MEHCLIVGVNGNEIRWLWIVTRMRESGSNNFRSLGGSNCRVIRTPPVTSMPGDSSIFAGCFGGAERSTSVPDSGQQAAKSADTSAAPAGIQFVLMRADSQVSLPMSGFVLPCLEPDGKEFVGPNHGIHHRASLGRALSLPGRFWRESIDADLALR